MAVNGLSKDMDIPRLYEYLYDYETCIFQGAGKYNFNDHKLQKFLDRHDIFTSTMSKRKQIQGVKHTWYIFFDQYKKNVVSHEDVAHHLLRHIRNCIAHALIKKEQKKIDGRNIMFFRFKDFNGQKNTMIGYVEVGLFYQLLEHLKATRH